MGKGNRSRQDRAFQTVQNVEEVTPKSTKIKTAIATAVVAVLIVGCILLSVIVNTGIVLRSKSVAKTDNFSVSGTVMSYLVYSQAQSYAYYYQQMGMTNYTVSDIVKSFGIKEAVLSQVKEMLVLCEYAKANGISLSETDEADIDAYIDSIKEAAAQELYSTNAYVKLMYGNGVNINDIREALEISYLSQAALEKVQANLEGQITDELRNTYIEENPQSFYFTDYLTFSYSAKLVAEGAEATAEEKASYETSKTEMKALAETLAKAESVEKFNEIVIDYIVNTTAASSFDSIFESDYKADLEADNLLPNETALNDDKAAILAEITEELKTIYDVTVNGTEVEEEEEKTEEETKNAYQKALDEIRTELLEDAVTTYESTLVMDHPHYAPVQEGEEDKTTELDKWLFNAETKAGETKLTETVGDTTSTYSVSILKTASTLKDELSTYDVAHILVKFDSDKPTDEEKATAKAEAQAILDQYLAGEKTLDAFKALGEEKTDDSSVVYENVTKGQMVEAFETWSLDEARKEGDTEIVETEYGYHIMYFIDNATTSEAGVLADLYGDWVDAESEKCNYTYKQSVIDSIQ
ncbi:MAG: peptidylprolyl isomerase [Clostridia bacterium]|nr:peptidylprolyl isomerase [Clostridia bacterium]